MLLAGCAAVGIVTAAYAMAPQPLPGKMTTERQSLWQPPTMDSVVVIRTGGGLGTGFSIGNGVIVTAAHVVMGAKTVSIEDVDGNIRMARVDIVDGATDLAILSTSHKIPAAEIDCRMASVGEAITAIGTPLGLEFITAEGRVAGAARKIGGTNVLVTDIVTIMGMSGGPLFANGRVVGVNHAVMTVSSKLDGTDVDANAEVYSTSLVGFGFVIPSTDVCALLMRGEGEGV
jgi:serine protease Do